MKSIPNVSCTRLTIALIVMASSLAACSDKPQPPVPKTAPDPLFKTQRDALDKAKGVEQIEAKHTDELKQEEEKQAR